MTYSPDPDRVREVLVGGRWYKVHDRSFKKNIDLGYPPGSIGIGFFFIEKGSGNGMYGHMNNIQMLRCK